MTKIQKNSLITLLVSLVIMVFYWHISFKTTNVDFFKFISQYFILFALFMLLVKIERNFNRLIFLAICIRVMLIFSVPQLSPDFYRFIWDGELLTKGINPYAHLPNELISYNGFYDSQYMRSVYKGITELSQGNYTNYPVLNQFIFFIPTYFFDSIKANVIGLKIIVLLADLGAIYYLKKIFNVLKLPIKNIWFYALNPFIIIEFMGNLHFEGVMIFFLLTSIYFSLKNNWILAGIFLAFSIHIKLIPIMFIPFFFKHFKWKQSVGFLAITCLVVLIFGQLLWNKPLYFNNMFASIEIYFNKFQFNSSLFGIVNHFKSTNTGWDTTALIGPLLSKIATVLIVLLSILRNYSKPIDIIKGILFALMVYYFLATTIHPWYISTVLVLSIMTNYKFGLVWTLLIPLTYAFYYVENSELLIKWFEYVIVYSLLFYEIIIYTSKKDIKLNFKHFFNLNT